MDEAMFASLDEAIRCSIQKFLIACMDEYSEGIRAGQPREECSWRLRERIQNSVVCEMIDSSCVEQCESNIRHVSARAPRSTFAIRGGLRASQAVDSRNGCVSLRPWLRNRRGRNGTVPPWLISGSVRKPLSSLTGGFWLHPPVTERANRPGKPGKPGYSPIHGAWSAGSQVIDGLNFSNAFALLPDYVVNGHHSPGYFHTSPLSLLPRLHGGGSSRRLNQRAPSGTENTAHMGHRCAICAAVHQSLSYQIGSS